MKYKRIIPYNIGIYIYIYISLIPIKLENDVRDEIACELVYAIE
jgi:hypothetical protein